MTEYAKGDLRLFGWIRAKLGRELRLRRPPTTCPGPRQFPRAGATPDWVAGCFAALVCWGRFGLQWGGDGACIRQRPK